MSFLAWRFPDSLELWGRLSQSPCRVLLPQRPDELVVELLDAHLGTTSFLDFLMNPKQ